MSQHLQALRKAGLVSARRDGRRVLYRIANDNVLRLLASLREVAEHQVAEVERIVAGYFHDRDSLDPVSREELQARIKDGLVTVLDVRPEDEFASGHLPGAVNVPLSQLRKRLTELPKRQEVIAYCRGPWCVLAFEAVAMLREAGAEGAAAGWRPARMEDRGPAGRVKRKPKGALKRRKPLLGGATP